MNGLVSIIVPVYKVEQYISYSITSVIKQSYKNIEVIIVDDGTPDNSVGIAEKLLKNSNVSYKIYKQENKGLGEARNTGLRQAKGEWVYFLDSDDAIVKNTIEKMVESAESCNPNFVFSKFNRIKSMNEAQSSCVVENIQCLDNVKLINGFLDRSIQILAPGTLYKRSWLLENGLWFEKIPWSEDQQFIWRILSVTEKAVFMNSTFYQYLQRPGSIMDSSSISKMICGYEEIQKLPQLFENGIVCEYLVPRWVMGTINSASVISDYSEWCKLWERIEAKKSFKVLLNFPDYRVRILSILGICSPKLYYLLMRKKRI